MQNHVCPWVTGDINQNRAYGDVHINSTPVRHAAARPAMRQTAAVVNNVLTRAIA